jgi:hypothetical protein
MNLLLAARSTEPLAAVRAITSQYRMTNKPKPTRPSHYVAGIIAPLKVRTLSQGWLAHRSRKVC